MESTKGPGDPEVAVLLATHNGAAYVEAQLRSLKQNATPFTLNWLDDQSTDNTRELTRLAAERHAIVLKEWHGPSRHGCPQAFFRLLQCVEADIYLFCDQDDVWQAGKIDAICDALVSELCSPVLCFSDPLIFRSNQPTEFVRLSTVTGARPEEALRESRMFMAATALGHTQGFTRPLRDLFLRHLDIAFRYAIMHDVWMYNLAVAVGRVKFLSDAPTTLYRWHDRNTMSSFTNWKGMRIRRITITQAQHRILRRGLARHAAGFILAAHTLPPGSKLENLLRIARTISTIDRRLSLTQLLRMARAGTMWVNKRLAIGLAISCLCTDATEREERHVTDPPSNI